MQGITLKYIACCLVAWYLSTSYAAVHHPADLQAEKRIVAWENLIQNKSAKDEILILNKANLFFNQLTYIPDNPLLGQEDEWMTPYEFLGRGSGDCEDFAIAKFFTAMALGISPKKLRITYVTIKDRNQAHMVLTYYGRPDEEPLVLDNLIDKILPASQRRDLTPVYSFSLEDVRLHEDMKKTKRHGDASSLSKWRALVKRFKTQHRLRNER